MLHRNKLNVFGWYANFDGCGYYRVIKPLEALQDLYRAFGIATQSSRILQNDWQDLDVVVGQRVCRAEKEYDAAHLWLDICKDPNVMAVYEIDDDLFNLDPSNPAYPDFSDTKIQHNIRTCIAQADLVTVSTEPLREQLLMYNGNIKVLPNYVDEDLLNIPRNPLRHQTMIGWAGSQTHSMDFPMMGDALEQLVKDDVVFMTIGGRYGEDLPKHNLRHLPWFSSTRKLYSHIARFDIGVAPLKQHVFNDSKSWIKVLEYAALGIPCVASAARPYENFVEHGVTGFLASTQADWHKYLKMLVEDVGLRLQMGQAARDKASDFTIQKNIDMWLNAYTA